MVELYNQKVNPLPKDDVLAPDVSLGSQSKIQLKVNIM